MTGSKPKLVFLGIAWPLETFLAHLVIGLLDSGWDITVACARKPDKIWLSQRGLKWLPTPSWEVSLPIRLPRMTWMACRAAICAPEDFRLFARDFHRSGRYPGRLQRLNQLLPLAGSRWDVIYFPWNFAAASHLPLFEYGCPVVISCRGSQINVALHDPRRSPIQPVLKETFQRASAVHCVSDAIKREAMKYGLDSHKTWVIHPAVDPDFFVPGNERRSDHSKYRLVTTGALLWVKGHEFAIHAIRKLVDRGIPAHLDIIGDGPERQRVLYTIFDLGLEQNVRLHGRLEPREVRACLQRSDVFLLSSLSEGMSNAALEAMSCGLPVVTSDCGGMREGITDGIEGFVVPVRDSDAMSQALETIWQDSELRVRMGQAARQRVLREFTLRQQVDEFSRLFQSVLEH